MKTSEVYIKGENGIKGDFKRDFNGQIYAFNELGRLKNIRTGIESNVSPAFDEEWELIPQEVTWQEAIQAYLNNKAIYIECEGATYEQSPHFRFGCNANGIDEKLFRKGKWFVKS